MFLISMLIILCIVIGVIFWQISTLFSLCGGIHYVDSGENILRSAFKIAGLKKGEIFYELGSGIGSGLVIASREFGAKAVGIEISPFHFLISKARTISDKNIKVIRSNFYKIDLSKADKIYCYLTPNVLKKLLPKFERELKKETIVIVNSFKIPGKKEFLSRKISGKTIYLYHYESSRYR